MTIAEFVEIREASAEQIEGFLGDSDHEPDEDGRYDAAALVEAVEAIEQAAFDELVEAQEDVAYQRQALADAERALYSQVRQALVEEGIPAARVAEVLGVSRARVYQMRDGKR